MSEQRETSLPPPGIGDKLRFFRKERRLTIRALAEQAGLSPNTISLIENNSASPTVTTLYAIANVLDIPLSAFFLEEVKEEEVRLVRAQDQKRTLTPGVHVNVLPDNVLDGRVHILHFVVEPGKGSGSDMMTHPGDELVICIRG